MNAMQLAMKIAKPDAPVVCPACHGLGQIKAHRTKMEIKEGEVKTVQLGSGCPKCLGRGVLQSD